MIKEVTTTNHIEIRGFLTLCHLFTELKKGDILWSEGNQVDCY